MDSDSEAREVASANTVDFLCFDIGDERFAVALTCVSEVVDAVELVTGVHSGSVVGVLRLRGELVPAHSAAGVLRVELQSSEPLALVLEARDHRLAVLVDFAEAVQMVCLDNLNPLPALGSSDRVMIGALRVNQRWVAVVDADALVDALIPNAVLEPAYDH